MELSQAIKAMFSRRNTTQRELAVRTGMAESNMSRILAKQDYRVNKDLLFIANHLDFDVQISFIDRHNGDPIVTSRLPGSETRTNNSSSQDIIITSNVDNAVENPIPNAMEPVTPEDPSARLTGLEIQMLELAALLHDIGREVAQINDRLDKSSHEPVVATYYEPPLEEATIISQTVSPIAKKQFIDHLNEFVSQNPISSTLCMLTFSCPDTLPYGRPYEQAFFREHLPIDVSLISTLRQQAIEYLQADNPRPNKQASPSRVRQNALPIVVYDVLYPVIMSTDFDTFARLLYEKLHSIPALIDTILQENM